MRHLLLQSIPEDTEIQLDADEDDPSLNNMPLFSRSSSDLSSLFNPSSSDLTSSSVSGSTVLGPGADTGRFIKALGGVILDGAAEVRIWCNLLSIQTMLEDWHAPKNFLANSPLLVLLPINAFCGSKNQLAGVKQGIKVLRELSQLDCYPSRVTAAARRIFGDLYAWLAREVPRWSSNPEVAHLLLLACKTRASIGSESFSQEDFERILRIRQTQVSGVPAKRCLAAVERRLRRIQLKSHIAERGLALIERFTSAYSLAGLSEDCHDAIFSNIIGKFCLYDPHGHLMSAEFKHLLRKRTGGSCVQVLHSSPSPSIKKTTTQLFKDELTFPYETLRDILEHDTFCSKKDLFPIAICVVDISIVLQTLSWLVHASYEWTTTAARDMGQPISRRLILLAFHSVSDHSEKAHAEISIYIAAAHRNIIGLVNCRNILPGIQDIIDACAFQPSKAYVQTIESLLHEDREGKDDVSWDWTPALKYMKAGTGNEGDG